MEFTKVKFEVKEKVAIISMDSPKNMNAFDEVLLDELVEAIAMADANADVKVMLINSTTDKAFSAGGDVAHMYEGLKQCAGDKAMFAGEFGKAIAKMANVTKAILRSPKPAVAAVQGACAGAGIGLALACDYSMATQATVFLTAFSKIGLVPDAGLVYLLTRAVGLKKAVELSMDGGQMVFADDAKALGMLNEVIEDDDQFADETFKRAKKFTYGPSYSYNYIKQLVWESEFTGFDAFVAKEVDAQMTCGATDDFEEGVTAFCEKKRASFA